MSFDTLRRQRLINIIGISRTTTDPYGNEVDTEAQPVEEWCRRQLLTSTEDVADREQFARTFRYFFRAEAEISGSSIIDDDGQRLKVVGEPEVVTNALGPHHIEVLASLVEG